MAQHGPSVTLSLTLPITCHICLGKVTLPLPSPLSPPPAGGSAVGAGRGSGPARPPAARGGPAVTLTPGGFASFKGLQFRAGEKFGGGGAPFCSGWWGVPPRRAGALVPRGGAGPGRAAGEVGCHRWGGGNRAPSRREPPGGCWRGLGAPVPEAPVAPAPKRGCAAPRAEVLRGFLRAVSVGAGMPSDTR